MLVLTNIYAIFSRHVLEPGQSSRQSSSSSMSKQERRKLFEAQVQAQDRIQSERFQQHMEYLKDPEYVAYLQSNNYEMTPDMLALIEQYHGTQHPQPPIVYQDPSTWAAAQQHAGILLPQQQPQPQTVIVDVNGQPTLVPAAATTPQFPVDPYSQQQQQNLQVIY